MIESTSRSAPALAPLFRSDQQLRLLAVLFADVDEELSIGELARQAGVAQATASREVARLADHGLVKTRAIGRNTMVAANWDLLWATDLRSILVKTVGVLGRLGQAMSDLAGVDQAFVFGSWAARYTGQAGLPPRDIDVVVVGDADLQVIRRALAEVESELNFEINPVVIEPTQWAAIDPNPFVAELRTRPLVPVTLNRA
jgi:DNA-binding transcriptional ArsR family regulator